MLPIGNIFYFWFSCEYIFPISNNVLKNRKMIAIIPERELLGLFRIIF